MDGSPHISPTLESLTVTGQPSGVETVVHSPTRMHPNYQHDNEAPAMVEVPPSSSSRPPLPPLPLTSSPPHAVVAMPSNHELLLREWNDHDLEQSNSTLDLPPVAPAVVLNEASSSTGSGSGGGGGSAVVSSSTQATPRGYTYPVATFVSNLVRSSVNELRDHIIAVTAIPDDMVSNWRSNHNHHHHHPNDSAGPLHDDPFSSFHSMDAPTLIETPSSPPTSQDPRRVASPHRNDECLRHDTVTTSTTATTTTTGEGGSSSSSSQFVLIDGDLVAIPAFHDQYMDDYESRSGRQLRQERRQQRRQQQQQQHQKKKHEKRKSQTNSSNSTSGMIRIMQGDDDGGLAQSHDHDANVSSNPSRVHRGMRKVTKWMKKKHWIASKKGKEDTTMSNNSQVLEDSVDGSAGISTQSSPPLPSEVAAAATINTTTTNNNNNNNNKPRKKSPPRAPKVKRRVSRRGWASRDASPPHHGRHQLLEEGTEVQLLPPFSRSREMSNLSVLSSDSSTLLEAHSTSSPSLATASRAGPSSSVASMPAAASISAHYGTTSNTTRLTLDALPTSRVAAAPIGVYGQFGTASGDFALAGDPLAAATTLSSSFSMPPAHGHYRTPSDNVPAISASLLPPELESPSMNRQASIAAEYVGFVALENIGTTDNILPDHVLAAEAYIEDRLDDYDKYDKKDMPKSMVPRDADFKVDKLDAPCVDSMLRRAGEFAQDMNEEDDVMEVPAMAGAVQKGKSGGESVPLSMATGRDTLVHNDILKLVMVGDARVDKSALARSLRQSTKKPRARRTTLGVEVHSWTPPNDDNVRFTIWDVQGASVDASPFDANFGAHHGTQSLFFTDQTLYLLVWDLAGSNRKTYRRATSDNHNDSEEEDDEEDDNERLREEANRHADMALQADIEERVLSWVDCIARSGHQSAILPVAMVSGNMSPEEAKRRCDVMQMMIMQHTKLMEKKKFPKVLSGAETVFCVSLETNMGMDLLEATILAIANDASHSVFDHVGTPVPLGTTMVLEICRRLKQEYKLVLVDHLLEELSLVKGEMGMVLSVEEVMEALHFLSSIGECLYFGGIDDILSHYVILSRKWLVSALSCVLRNDLKRELAETRKFMNMQSFYSDQRFPENPVTQTFSTSSSVCPLLSSSDTQMLWQSMSFMREAADIGSQRQANNTSSSTMFGFLEHLLVHTGVFLPLDIDRFTSPDVVYFVPSLLAQSKARDVWTYKSSESWMTTLAHSWLFRTPTIERDGLMEHVTVGLLRDLYEFSHVVASRNAHSPPHRSQTFPFAQNTLTDFMTAHDGEAIGHIKIHQMMCWKNSLLVKIGCIFPEGTELRESFVEIFVTIADPSSPHCVASNIMQSSMQRLIISGKGQVGYHGRKLWRGGYRVVLDSVKASVADCANVDLQVVCPECLAHSHPSSASTLSWDAVRAAAETGSSIVRCMHGHRADSNLICGTVRSAVPKAEGAPGVVEGSKKTVKDIFPSVVLVALYDPETKSVKNVGSGFIVDKKQGLVVTAGHILFNMEQGSNFGTTYFGIKNAMVLIGIITEEKAQRNNNVASFRYIAKIVADDIHYIDACVVKIIDRFTNDVDDESAISEVSVNRIVDIAGEHLPTLKTTRRFELEENVRILGFNQGGEGWLEMGKHVNRSADLAKGYICKQFKLDEDKSDSDSDDSSSSGGAFRPREEIVVICKTIPGHSGSPAVNSGGTVVGILSRSDPVDPTRCYLVPSSELKVLVNKAKKTSSRVGGLKLAY